MSVPDSIRRQSALLGWRARAYVGCCAQANDNDLVIRRIDELYTAWLFLGSRRVMALLRTEGYKVNRKRVQRLMPLIGIATLRPKPRASKPTPEDKIFPYLFHRLPIE